MTDEVWNVHLSVALEFRTLKQLYTAISYVRSKGCSRKKIRTPGVDGSLIFTGTLLEIWSPMTTAVSVFTRP